MDGNDGDGGEKEVSLQHALRHIRVFFLCSPLNRMNCILMWWWATSNSLCICSKFESRIRLVNTRTPKWEKLPPSQYCGSSGGGGDGGVEHQADKINTFPCQVRNPSDDCIHEWTNKERNKKRICLHGKSIVRCVCTTRKSLMSLMRKFKQNKLVIAFKKLCACNACSSTEKIVDSAIFLAPVFFPLFVL